MPSYCYFKGAVVPLEDARISVMTHALHYGTGLFEGIRANWNAAHGQLYIFRLLDHMKRMKDGCKVLRLDIPHTAEDLSRITVDVVNKCGFKEDTYVRPLAYKSSEALGVRLHDLKSDFLVFAIPWGRYIDVDTCRCAVSTWRRPDDNVFPPSVKATGLYINNALTKTEAIENGFDEGIMLTPDGHVAEGSGENLFLVENGKLVTPATYSSILNGITRDTVIQLAKNELGLEVEERLVDRYELYTADECFLTGTAAHLTPVCEIDRRRLGEGGIGPVTAKLKDLYFEAIKGNLPKYAGWCTPVY